MSKMCKRISMRQKAREFAAVILRDGQGRILWVKRSNQDEDDAGQWSLPAGEKEEGEDPPSTARRELEEETGIVAGALTYSHTLDRGHWSVTFFICDEVYDGEITLSDEFSEYGFFFIEDTPENTVFDALYGVLISCKSEVNFRPSQLVEKVFTSIFYTYLVAGLHEYGELKTINYLNYITLSTPNRKFKSVIPFLLAGCPSEERHRFLLGDLFFSYFTLHDDLSDALTQRYGIPTVASKFGAHRAVSALTLMPFDLDAATKISGINDISSPGLVHQICQQQYNRFHKRYHEFGDYLADSYERTRFLEDIWTSILAGSSCEREANFVQEWYRTFAQIGQVTNDLMDMGFQRSGVLSSKPLGVDKLRGIYSSETILGERGLTELRRVEYLESFLQDASLALTDAIQALGGYSGTVLKLWTSAQFQKWEFDESREGSIDFVFEALRQIYPALAGIK